MRDILSKHKEEKKAKRNQIILGIFLIFIMFFSVAEYSFLANDDQNTNQGNADVQKINYNGNEFSFQNGFWVLNKDGNSFVFKYNPNQVDKISGNFGTLEDYINKTIYINSEDLISESEIRVNLAQFSRIENSQNKSCDDKHITIKESAENKISQDKNCIFIEGKKESMARLTDEFLFKILGVEN